MTTWTSDNASGSIDHQSYYPYTSGGKRRHLVLGPSFTCKSCCFCLFLLLVFLILLFIAVVVVFVISLKPMKPRFDLQQVSVHCIRVAPTDAAVAGGSSSPAYLSLDVTLLFVADNPNRVAIRYDRMALDVMYRGVAIEATTVARFQQPADSRRLVEIHVSVDRFNFLSPDAADLVHDAVVNDNVELRITGDVGARFQVLGLTSARVQAAVDCVIVFSPKNQSLKHKHCVVEGEESPGR